jgi:hypothetical protein
MGDRPRLRKELVASSRLFSSSFLLGECPYWFTSIYEKTTSTILVAPFALIVEWLIRFLGKKEIVGSIPTEGSNESLISRR